MTCLKYILMPLLGGIIGYITNDIAIKMLFWPRKAIYIGKWKLPFTPGLIPRQKDRIARSIGNVVSAQLLNAETLQASLLSDDSLKVLRVKAAEFVDGLAVNEDTIRTFAAKYVDQEKFEAAVASARENIEHIIIQKITEADIGASVIARTVRLLNERLKEKLNIGIQALLFNKEFMEQIETVVSSAINDLIRTMAPDIVHTEIQKISNELLDRRFCDLNQDHQEKIPGLINRFVALYERILAANIGKIVRAVDISEII